MNDDQAQTDPTQSVPVPQSDTAQHQIVDDLVSQGKSIQDLFAQNDAAAADSSASPAQDPAQAAPPADDSQRSPLDILEEILNKEEKKAEEQVPVDQGPSPEELARIKQLEEQEKQLIEEQRQKMHAEVNTDEQKQRDQIRQQQSASNQVNNPYEIKQLERKKIFP